jgi:hypothetical protein
VIAALVDCERTCAQLVVDRVTGVGAADVGSTFATSSVSDGASGGVVNHGGGEADGDTDAEQSSGVRGHTGAAGDRYDGAAHDMSYEDGEAMGLSFGSGGGGLPSHAEVDEEAEPDEERDCVGGTNSACSPAGTDDPLQGFLTVMATLKASIALVKGVGGGGSARIGPAQAVNGPPAGLHSPCVGGASLAALEAMTAAGLSLSHLGGRV